MRLIFAAMATLALAGCAGTPPAGEQQASATGHHARCERSIGSMLCGNGDDQAVGNLNQPGGSLPSANGRISSGK